MIKEPRPQEEPTQKQVPEGKGKKKVKESLLLLLKIPHTLPLEEQERNKLREEAWLQRLRNLAIGVGTSEPRSPSIS